MRHTHFLLTGLLLLGWQYAQAEQVVGNPVLDANVTMQVQHFNGESFEAFSGYASGPTSKYSLRHASLGVSGCLANRVHYEFRAGSATCLAGGAFTLMDASVLYEVVPGIQVGFKKGEILRGFEFYDECVDVLTAEKPRFANVFAPCHPQGAVFELQREFSTGYELLMQAAYLDGSGEDLDEEHELNLGIQLRTPVSGITVGGFFTAIRRRYGPGLDNEMVQDAGLRWGLGTDCRPGNLVLRAEYYGLKGNYNNPYSGTLYREANDPGSYIESPDLKMQAWYAEVGYRVATGISALSCITPYLRFQSWDKGTNAAGDHEFSYYTAGLLLSLDSRGDTLLRIDYEDSVSTPAGQAEDASLLIVRLQASGAWLLALAGE